MDCVICLERKCDFSDRWHENVQQHPVCLECAPRVKFDCPMCRSPPIVIRPLENGSHASTLRHMEEPRIQPFVEFFQREMSNTEATPRVPPAPLTLRRVEELSAHRSAIRLLTRLTSLIIRAMGEGTSTSLSRDELRERMIIAERIAVRMFVEWEEPRATVTSSEILEPQHGR